CVYQSGYDVVRQACSLALARGALFLKALEMTAPALIADGRELGELKVQSDVGKVIGERRPAQPLAVLNDERFWPQLAYHLNGCRKHVPLVRLGAVLTTYREWLAWRPPR